MVSVFYNDDYVFSLVTVEGKIWDGKLRLSPVDVEEKMWDGEFGLSLMYIEEEMWDDEISFIQAADLDPFISFRAFHQVLKGPQMLTLSPPVSARDDRGDLIGWLQADVPGPPTIHT